jgi:hypothetical protein
VQENLLFRIKQIKTIIDCGFITYVGVKYTATIAQRFMGKWKSTATMFHIIES